MPQYVLGFRELANLVGRDIVGDPVEDEHYAANGDSQQQTTRGLMVWRKADNWTAFTNGYWTWIRGPFGAVYKRLNDVRFGWEADGYRPTVYEDPAPAAARSPMWWRPQGIILHGSRSGRRQSRFLEFHGTRAYCRSGCGGQYLAWTLTVGEDEISQHLSLDEWGYHARDFWSQNYIGVEFAQPTEAFDITDAQVRALAWWIREKLLVRHPGMPMTMYAHSEISSGITDGKSDVFRADDPRLVDLMERILGAL